MRDYSVLNGMIEKQKSELRTAYDKGYNQGVRDTDFQLAISKRQDEAYKQGLHDAWACCKRFLNSDDKVCDKIFGVSGWADFLDQSPSEAIEKFKEYDEKQEHIIRCCKNCKHSEKGMVGNSKRCEDCHYDRVSRANTQFEPMETDNSKIEVGDEVRDDMFDKVGVVIRIADNHAYVLKKDGIGTWTLDAVVKTGNHFEEVSDMMKHLENTDA